MGTELWSKPLMSLDLIRFLAEDSKTNFFASLIGLVQEEVFASQILIFCEGELCTAAYYIVGGVITIKSTFQDNIEPFKTGQWVGEKSLVNPLLHRSGSAVTSALTSVLVVPGHDFHEL